MKILMLVPHYSPDLGPSAPLFTTLANELVKRGHNIYVLTTVPHYPTGLVPSVYQGKLIQKSTENGVEIARIRVPSLKRANLANRLFQFTCYQLGATIAGWSKQYDAVFVANPALWVWLPFFFLVVLRQKPAIFSIYDVYPDVGISLGIFRHKLVIAMVDALERFCLDRSRMVRIISEAFRPAIQNLGVPDSKITLIYDWVDTELIKPVPRKNVFSHKYNLNDYFVIQYAGNLGYSQGFEHILTAAKQLSAYQDILFVIIGDGPAKGTLIAEVEKYGLPNVRFFPFQPREQLPYVLASADVSLVTLKPGVGTNSLPNKTLSILASSRPILACVEEGCETSRLVSQSQAGICTPPEDPLSITEAILTLRKDIQLREKMGANGREWALINHSPKIAARKLEECFFSILPNGCVENEHR